MSAASGLAPHEITILEAVEDLEAGLGAADRGSGDPQDARRGVPSLDVLAAVERGTGIGPRYSYPMLVDLAVPWLRQLPLLTALGNVGSQGDDPPADARYTEVRLGPFGRLALAAERGQVGPVPFGLIEGTYGQGGGVPPFAPAAVVAALRTGSGDAGPPVLPTGGVIEGDVVGLLAGKRVTVTLLCRIVHERQEHHEQLVITEVPLGSNPDTIVEMIVQRVASDAQDPGRRYADYLPEGERAAARPPVRRPVRDVRDDSTASGTRLVVVVEPGVDAVDALAWLREIWPVSVQVQWQLPAPQEQRLRDWRAGDGSGLAALQALV